MSFIVVRDNYHKWGHWNLKTPDCMLHAIPWWIDEINNLYDTYKYTGYVTCFHWLVWCASLCGWEMMYPVQRIVVNCTFSLEWLRTLGKLSFAAALIISVSSGKAFFSLWSTRRGVSAKPSQLYCCTIHSRQNLISLGGYRVRGAYSGESFWSSCLPICILFCQQETCAWAFFVQVYMEEYETAMGFGGLVGCLFFFFNFISKVDGKFNSSANG